MYEGLKVQIFVKGEPRGSKVILKPEINIGEDSDSDIWLDDEEVETRQARISLLRKGALLESFEEGKTFLNGKAIGSPKRLKEGDIVSCGSSKVVIEKLYADGERLAAERKSRFFLARHFSDADGAAVRSHHVTASLQHYIAVLRRHSGIERIRIFKCKP
jgi:hypothetical protein